MSLGSNQIRRLLDELLLPPGQSLTNQLGLTESLPLAVFVREGPFHSRQKVEEEEAEGGGQEESGNRVNSLQTNFVEV
jgi:hypothetical protein